jgi:predicted Rossmann fold nucleotide-binding protein DprA/Smf involved in DNA uptake
MAATTGIGIIGRHILICGSRRATQEMLDYARQSARKALLVFNASIIVGDAPGVDHAVIAEAMSIDPERLWIFGITPQPRNGPESRYIQVYTYSYMQRDRHMANLCSDALAIWDGESPGTFFTHNYVLDLGKSSVLKNFGEHK